MICVQTEDGVGCKKEKNVWKSVQPALIREECRSEREGRLGSKKRLLSSSPLSGNYHCLASISPSENWSAAGSRTVGCLGGAGRRDGTPA